MSRKEEMEKLRAYLEATKASGAYLPGSDLMNQIKEVRRRSRRERFTPTSALGSDQASLEDMAIYNNSLAKIIEQSVAHLKAISDAGIEGNKLRQAQTDVLMRTVEKKMEAEQKLKGTAMTQERMAISDMWEGVKAGIELYSTGLGTASSGESAGEVDRKYQLKKTKAFNDLYRNATKDNITQRAVILNTLNADELEGFLNLFSSTMNGQAAELDLTIHDLTGYNSIKEAQAGITNTLDGVLGTMPTADQNIIRGLQSGDAAPADSTAGSTNAALLDAYLENNVLPPGVKRVGSNEMAANLMGFYLAYDPMGFTAMYNDPSLDRMGLIKWIRENGHLDMGKDIATAASSLARGDEDTWPDVLDSLVGNYNRTDAERSNDSRIATNIAHIQESALGPKTGLPVNPQTQKWYSLANDPMIQATMKETGRTFKQTLNDFTRQSRSQARENDALADYDHAQKKKLFASTGGRKRDWLAHTITGINLENQERVNDAVDAGDGSAVLLGDDATQNTGNPDDKNDAGE